MPRGPSSPAERKLLAHLRVAEFSTTASALERWRAAGLAPRLPRRALGRGKGSTSWLDEDIVKQTIAAASAVRRTRSLERAALLMFVEGQCVPEATVRRAYVAVIEKLLAAAEAEALPGESMLDTLDRWARRAARVPPPAVKRARRRLRNTGHGATNADLLLMQASSLLAGRIDDKAAELFVLGSGADPALITDAAAITGDVAALLHDVSLHGLHHLVIDAGWDELCRARDFLREMGAFARVLAIPARAQGTPDALGLTEIEQLSEMGRAFAILGTVEILRRLPSEADEFLLLMQREGPRLQAQTSLILAMGQPVMPSGPEDYLASLSAPERERQEQVIRDWVQANPEAAELLND